MSYSPLTPLDGRVAIVTGGARGIGLEAARALQENGAKIVIVDINAEAGENAAKELGADFVRTDLTRSAEDEGAPTHKQKLISKPRSREVRQRVLEKSRDLVIIR